MNWTRLKKKKKKWFVLYKCWRKKRQKAGHITQDKRYNMNHLSHATSKCIKTQTNVFPAYRRESHVFSRALVRASLGYITPADCCVALDRWAQHELSLCPTWSEKDFLYFSFLVEDGGGGTILDSTYTTVTIYFYIDHLDWWQRWGRERQLNAVLYYSWQKAIGKSVFRARTHTEPKEKRISYYVLLFFPILFLLTFRKLKKVCLLPIHRWWKE